MGLCGALYLSVSSSSVYHLQEAQLLKKLRVCLEGYVRRMSERDLGPGLMISNTLNSSFGPSYSGFREISC